MARDLRIFYLFRLLATSYLWVPIFYFFLQSRGLSEQEIWLLGAIYSGTVILVEVPTGAFADRIGRRQSMMAGALAMVASCIVSYTADHFAVFVVAEVLAAISMSLCSGADSAYLFDLLETNGRGEEYPRREGTASAWHQAGSAVAFAGGGVLAEIDLALPYLVTAGVAAVAFVVAWTMKPDMVRSRAHRPAGTALREYRQHMSAAFASSWKSAKLLWVIGFSAAVFVLLRATPFLYQPYLEARDFDYSQTGFVFAAVYLVAMFVAHRGDSLRRRFGEGALVWTMLGTLTVTFLLLNELSGAWALCILGVQASANGLYSPLVKPLLNRHIGDSTMRATVLSIESIVRRVAFLTFSLVIALFGVESAIYVCGGLGIVATFVLFMTFPDQTAIHRARVPRAKLFR